jgi:hypothetical protein
MQCGAGSSEGVSGDEHGFGKWLWVGWAEHGDGKWFWNDYGRCSDESYTFTPGNAAAESDFAGAYCSRGSCGELSGELWGLDYVRVPSDAAEWDRLRVVAQQLRGFV